MDSSVWIALFNLIGTLGVAVLAFLARRQSARPDDRLCRKVEIGIADNSFMEIKSGVAKDEEVVSGSYKAISTILKDGMKVMV